MRSRIAIVAAGAAVTLAAFGLTACSGGTSDTPSGDTVTIKLGSWRTEDTTMWENDIIPAFEKSHPGITVEYVPVDTNDYNAAMQSQIESGTGPDVIMCRPFDVNRQWIQNGYFDPSVNDLSAIKDFDQTALAAWQGDDGKSYCVPAASVLAGFYYNKAIFKELGLSVPTTQKELLDTLKKIQDNGKYDALALGSADGWQLSYNVLDSIGPNYWKGEDGRLGLIDGTQKLTAPDFVAAFQAYADLRPYLPSGFESLKYADMMQLFTLGKAAIIPDGSWNISAATATGLDVGVFAAPVAKAGDQRYQQEMPDQAFGLNAKSKNKDAAKEFLEWVGSKDFQQLYVNKLPGFFSMGTDPVTYDNPLAQQFADLKKDAKLTPRLQLDRLSAGNPPLDDSTWTVLQEMYNNGLSAEDATSQLQVGLDSWYKPAQ